jgi:hypothetical protein
MKKVLLKISLICILSFAFHSYAKAQTDPNGDPDLPLDPGSWVLVAAGVGYGVKKWRDTKQQSQNVTEVDKNSSETEMQSNKY